LGVRGRRARARRRGPRSRGQAAARVAKRGARALIVALGCALVANACSSGNGPLPAAAGHWTLARASFELPRGSTGRDRGPVASAVIAVPGGWAAVGSIAEREFAAWQATDGVHWRLTQHAAEV